MKVIFLDIDGVLNSEASMRDFGIRNTWNDNPHPMHIEWLNMIVEKTGAKVVISSTWRTSGSPHMFGRLLYLLGFIGEVIDRTPNLDTERGTEIKSWLFSHIDKLDRCKNLQWAPSWMEPIESFVILDDDDDMLELSATNLVLIKDGTGLQEEHALKAIEILNGVKYEKVKV